MFPAAPVMVTVTGFFIVSLLREKRGMVAETPHYCRTRSAGAVALHNLTPSSAATVGATCRMSICPRSRCREMPRPTMKSAARTHRHSLGGGVDARLDQAGLHERDVEIDAMREFHEAVVGYDHDDGRGVALARCGDQPSQHFVDALEILVGCSAERALLMFYVVQGAQ